jgi:hypothetical protein
MAYHLLLVLNELDVPLKQNHLHFWRCFFACLLNDFERPNVGRHNNLTLSSDPSTISVIRHPLSPLHKEMKDERSDLTRRCEIPSLTYRGQSTLGGAMDGHPWNEEVGIKLDEPDHPLTAAFEGEDFRLAEEIFQFRDPYSRERNRVLLSLDVPNTNMEVPWIYRTDGDFALAWTRSEGEGRIFYTAIGHRTEHYWNPTLLRFYLDGVQFCTGDLEAPSEPMSNP